MIAVKIVDTKQDSFVHGTYNGIEIITRKSNGYVNASKMVQVLRGTEDTHFNRFLRENKSWKEYLDAFKEKMSLAESGQAQKLTPSYYLKNVAPNRRLKNESTKEFYLDEKVQIENCIINQSRHVSN